MILRKRYLQIEIKKRLLHTYDIKSRANLLYKKPIYGNDTLNLIKLTFLFDTINSPLLKNHIVYGKKSRKKILGMNFTTCLNKAYKYCNLNKVIIRNNDFMKITEYGEMEKVNLLLKKLKKVLNLKLKLKIYMGIINCGKN